MQNAREYFEEGEAESKLYQYKSAISKYDHALELDSEFKEAIVGKAIPLMKMDKNNEAKILFDNIISLHPSHLLALNGRGRNFLILGQYQAAEIDLNNALNLNPKNVETLCNLGIMESVKGNYGLY